VNVGETERILSIGAGAIALLAGLDRRPLGALLCFATGAGLLYRGLSGHCSLYSAMDMSTADGDESTMLQPREQKAGASLEPQGVVM
jgi:uncharacterized membrane protein